MTSTGSAAVSVAASEGVSSSGQRVPPLDVDPGWLPPVQQAPADAGPRTDGVDGGPLPPVTDAGPDDPGDDPRALPVDAGRVDASAPPQNGRTAGGGTAPPDIDAGAVVLDNGRTDGGTPPRTDAGVDPAGINNGRP